MWGSLQIDYGIHYNKTLKEITAANNKLMIEAHFTRDLLTELVFEES